MNKNLYSLTLEALAELAPEINAAQANVKPVLPSLTEVLADFSPFPREALFLGIAEDALPVLLNLYDPMPGPILLSADAHSGKTSFLQVIVAALMEMQDPNVVQFSVVTAYKDEWRGFEQSPHCSGIFHFNDRDGSNSILSLGKWAHTNRSRQSAVLLIDDLSLINEIESEAKDILRWLLLRGPARHVWPIVSVNPAQHDEVASWLELFRTRIFGAIRNVRLAETITKSAGGGLESLVAGSQFAMLEGSKWLKFWIPRLDEGESK